MVQNHLNGFQIICSIQLLPSCQIWKSTDTPCSKSFRPMKTRSTFSTIKSGCLKPITIWQITDSMWYLSDTIWHLPPDTCLAPFESFHTVSERMWNLPYYCSTSSETYMTTFYTFLTHSDTFSSQSEIFLNSSVQHLTLSHTYWHWHHRHYLLPSRHHFDTFLSPKAS